MSSFRSDVDTGQSSNGAAPKMELVCSCRPDKISSLFGSFVGQKAELVRSIEFGGLLKLPFLDNLHPELCLWLLQILDWNNKCLHLPCGVDLPIDYPDVHLVLGIPFQGRPVSISSEHTKEKFSAFSHKLFSGSTTSSHTVSFLEEILSKEYGSRMTTDEVDAFNIASILYAAIYLLAPGRHHNFPTKLLENFLPEVKPAQINWASLVLSMLDQASIDARSKFINGYNKIKMLGCCLFLQVFYLDNLNFGPSTPCHDLLPRASVYDAYAMKQRILADCIASSEEKLMIFGKTKVRHAFEVCYTRGWKEHFNMFEHLEQLSQDDYLSYIEMISQGIYLLGKIGEQANQLNLCSESHFEKRMEYTRKCYNEFKSKLNDTMNNFSIKAADFVKRRNIRLYQDYIPDDTRTTSQNQFSIGISEKAIRKKVNSSVSPLRRRIEQRRAESLEALMASGLTIEEAVSQWSNSGHVDHGQGSTPNLHLQKKIVSSHSNFPNKFIDEMFEHPSILSENKYRCYLWLTNSKMPIHERNRYWIVFNSPKPLHISGHVVSHCLSLNGSFTVIIMDAIMVVWSYLDEKMYKYYQQLGEPHSIWRHFLPASFAESVNNNSDYLNSAAIQASFIGHHISYNVEDYQQIIVPVLSGDNTWSCYIWDFKFKTITVLDPVLMRRHAAEAIQKHNVSVAKLHYAMRACISQFFCGWHVEHHGWNEVYLTNLMHKCSPQNSGLYEAHYARTYCGRKELAWKIKEEPEEDSLCFSSGEIFFHFVTCPYNKGYKSELLMERIGYINIDI